MSEETKKVDEVEKPGELPEQELDEVAGGTPGEPIQALDFGGHKKKPNLNSP